MTPYPLDPQMTRPDMPRHVRTHLKSGSCSGKKIRFGLKMARTIFFSKDESACGKKNQLDK